MCVHSFPKALNFIISSLLSCIIKTLHCEYVSECDQEITQSHTVNENATPRGRDREYMQPHRAA